jgi:hypothetical protein
MPWTKASYEELLVTETGIIFSELLMFHENQKAKIEEEKQRQEKIKQERSRQAAKQKSSSGKLQYARTKHYRKPK